MRHWLMIVMGAVSSTEWTQLDTGALNIPVMSKWKHPNNVVLKKGGGDRFGEGDVDRFACSDDDVGPHIA